MPGYQTRAHIESILSKPKRRSCVYSRINSPEFFPQLESQYPLIGRRRVLSWVFVLREAHALSIFIVSLLRYNMA